ncbi:MAG: hypothetical protein K0S41_3071 [Anaerocolumna sp.]|jgi:hypothetical protein|nr:hypothetical protein [Anaerocolumna sp.]
MVGGISVTEQRSLIVGFDLCDDYSQITCFSNKTMEPESICLNLDKTKYLIPTVLGVKKHSKDWIFGEDVIQNENTDTVEIIKGLLDKVEKNEETTVLGVKFGPITLLEKYLRKCLHLLKLYYPSNNILKIVITLKEVTKNLETGVYNALDNLGIGKDRAYVTSHMQSYQYYALSQSKDLWMNDIGLFDFDHIGLTYHQISINRKSHPYFVQMIEKDFSDVLNNKMLSDNTKTEQLSYTFDNIAKNVLHKQIVSTLYITGKGFEHNFADKVLRDLCVGRRVFKGQNLYAKGACYLAKERCGEHKLDDFLIASGEMITTTISLAGYFDAKGVEVILAKAATPWHEIDEKLDLLLDETEQVDISIKNVVSMSQTTYNILLDGLPNRPNKMTRVQVRLKFLNKSTAIITVKDLGFGEFYPSSNRIWEKEIILA